MPSRSEKQRKLFAIAEHNPSSLYSKNKSLASLPKKTLHEFASKVESSKRKKKTASYQPSNGGIYVK